MKHKARGISVIIVILGMITIMSILFVFGYIFVKGKDVLSLQFVLEKPGGMPLGTQGGIYPALIGSLYLGGLSALGGGILGVLGGLFLAFYSDWKKINMLLRLSIAGLSGIPSILYGLMGYTLLVYTFGWGRSLLTAAITVSVLILPYVAIRMYKIFVEKALPYALEAQRLGMSKEYALFRIVLLDTLPECLCTIALGMTYGIGAVAPILYTGVVLNAQIPTKLTDPFMSLPYHLYMLVTSGYGDDYAFATASVLLLFLLLVHGITKSIYIYRGRKR